MRAFQGLLVLALLGAALPVVSVLAQVNSSENNALVFTVNNVEHARISGTAGNLGIGTTNPLAKLAVAGTISATDIVQVGSTTAIACGNSVTGAIRYTNISDTLQVCTGSGWKSLASSTTAGTTSAASSTGAIQFNSGNSFAGDTSNLFWDDANNRLGIGNGSPGGITGSERVRIAHSATSGYPLAYEDSAGTVGAGLYVAANTAGIGTASNDPFTLRTGGSDRLAIDTSGNVGIGTTAPGVLLDVSGTGSSQYTEMLRLTVSNTSYGSSAAPFITMKRTDSIFNHEGGGGIRFDEVRPAGTVYNMGRFRLGQDDSYAQTPKSSFIFELNNGAALTEIMRIRGNGNVGIGTTTPSEKLHVQGRIMVSGTSYTLNPSGPIFGQYNATTGYLQAPSGGEIQIWKDDTSAIATFREDGNVGIGTTAPSAKLEVAASTTSPSIRVGNLMLQSYAADNEWIAQNLYFNGSWKYAGNGYGVRQYFSDGNYIIDTAPSNASGAGAAATATTRFLVANSGNVGIGDTSPNALLDVYGATNGQIYIDSGDGYPSLYFRDDDANKWRLYNHSSTGDRLYLADADGTSTVHMAQNATAWTAGSDVRLKTNIRDYTVLDRIADFRAVTFDWKKTGKHDFGVIAQEVYKAYPEVVEKGSGSLDDVIEGADDPRPWGVNYDRIGVLALQAVKELKAQNDALRARLERVEKQLQVD